MDKFAKAYTSCEVSVMKETKYIEIIISLSNNNSLKVQQNYITKGDHVKLKTGPIFKKK